MDKALASPVDRPNPLEEFDLEAGMAGMGAIAVGDDSSVGGVKRNGSAGVARSPRSNGAATATKASSDGRATSGAGSVAIGGLIGSSSLPTAADAAKAGGGVGVGHLPSSLDFFEDVTATPTLAGSSVEAFDAGLTNEEDDL